MSTLTNVRDWARSEVPSFSLGRALSLLSGAVVVGVETLRIRAELKRSRRHLAELDERLLRDIGLDRATARGEADRSYWA
jgi:uncharacterized protein YjiS (DUF1127 family)